MAGINYFYDEYKKRPREIEKLLDAEVRISEWSFYLLQK